MIVKPWKDYVDRVVIHATNYLNFDGSYSAGGRQRHIRDLASVIRDDWQKEVLIVQKGTHDFSKKCVEGFSVVGIKSNLTAYGDPKFAHKVTKILKPNDGLLYASGEDAWPFFQPGSKAVQHGVWWDGPQTKITQFIQKQRAIACMKVVRSMLCVDTNFINWLRGQGRSCYPLANKCVYVPNYVNLSKLTISQESKKLPIRIICARRYEEKRGIDLFVDSLGHLQKSDFPFTAHISTIGGVDAIKARISANNLMSKVTVSEDDMDTVLSRYSTADIAVVPTKWSEGTSLACVEAICAGLPVVTTPVGGLGNLVVPGFNGYLVEPNPISIGQEIQKFSNIDLLLEMRGNCLSLRKALSMDVWEDRVLNWLKQ